jgi:hypothetical protein
MSSSSSGRIYSIVNAILWVCTLIALTIAIMGYVATPPQESVPPILEPSNTPLVIPETITLSTDGQLSAPSFSDQPEGTRLEHGFFQTRAGITSAVSLEVNEVQANEVDTVEVITTRLTVSESVVPGHIIRSKDSLGTFVWVENNSNMSINKSEVSGTTLTNALNTLSAEMDQPLESSLPPALSIMTGKGDLITRRNDGETVRFPVGSDNSFLQSSSSEGSGLKWETPSGNRNMLGPQQAVVGNTIPVFNGTSGTALKTTGVTVESDGSMPLTGDAVLRSNASITKALVLNAADNVTHVGFKAPNVLTEDIVWKLPNSAGNAAQLMTVSHTGDLSWSDPGVGDISGPTSSTPNGIVSYVGTSGTSLKSSTTLKVSSGGDTLTVNGSNTVGVVLGNAGTPKNLKFLSANNLNHVGFKSPDTVVADVVWKLPSSGGEASQSLTTDGNRNLYWSTSNNNGDVVGPTTKVQGGIAYFDTTGGTSLGNSSNVYVDDGGALVIGGGSSPEGLILGIDDSSKSKAFVFGDLSGDHSVGFRGGVSIPSSVVWTLPSTKGELNTSLTTDGAGNLSWVDPTASNAEKLFGLRQVQVPGEFPNVSEALKAGAISIQVQSDVLEPTPTLTMEEVLWDTSRTSAVPPTVNAHNQITLDSASKLGIASPSGLDVGPSYQRSYFFRIDELSANVGNPVCFAVYDTSDGISNADLQIDLPVTGPPNPTKFIAWGSSGDLFHPTNGVFMGPARVFQQGDVFEITFDGNGNVTFDVVVGVQGVGDFPITVPLPGTGPMAVAVCDASNLGGQRAKVSVFMQHILFLPRMVQYNINVVAGVTWDMGLSRMHLSNSAGLRIYGGGIVNTGVVQGPGPVFESSGSLLEFDNVTIRRDTFYFLARGSSPVHIVDCLVDVYGLSDSTPWLEMSQLVSVERCTLNSGPYNSWWFGGTGGTIRDCVYNGTANSTFFQSTQVEEPNGSGTMIYNVHVNGSAPQIRMDRRISVQDCDGIGFKISWSVDNSSGTVPRRVSFVNCAIDSMGNANVQANTEDSRISFLHCRVNCDPSKTVSIGRVGVDVFTTLRGCRFDGGTNPPNGGIFQIMNGPASVVRNSFNFKPDFMAGSSHVIFNHNFTISEQWNIHGGSDYNINHNISPPL